MSLAFVAALIIIGVVGAVVLGIGIPALLGVIAYDMVKAPRAPRAETKDSRFRIMVERGVARTFVLMGGLFWSVATFAAYYSYRETGTSAALLAASLPMLACAVTLIVGWYYERFTAALLVLGSIAVVAWGVIYQFEAGVWAIMTFALLGPALTAAVLFWLARREQEAYERVMALRPELAFVFAARSTLAH